MYVPRNILSPKQRQDVDDVCRDGEGERNGPDDQEGINEQRVEPLDWRRKKDRVKPIMMLMM